MFAISKKTVIGAAIAALLGTVAITGASQAKITRIAPKFVLKIACAAGFIKGAGTNSYVCHKTFTVVCKKGMSFMKPTVKHLYGRTYRVSYPCYYPPK